MVRCPSVQEARSVGFVGLGNMGRHMAKNLLKAGCTLRVHDLDKAAVDALVASGAKVGRVLGRGYLSCLGCYTSISLCCGLGEAVKWNR